MSLTKSQKTALDKVKKSGGWCFYNVWYGQGSEGGRVSGSSVEGDFKGYINGRTIQSLIDQDFLTITKEKKWQKTKRGYTINFVSYSVEIKKQLV